MSWFKLDDQGHDHPKVLKAGNEAYGAWCRAGQWSSKHLTEGVIPKAIALTIAPARVWSRLVDAGLMEAHSEGWAIHDFLDYNPLAETVEARRKLRQEAGKIGGQRSGEARRSKANPEAPAKQVASPNEASCFVNGEANGEAKSNPVPDPVPDPGSDRRPKPLEVQVVEILRVELGELFATVRDPGPLVLQLLSKSRVDRADAPDRREVIRQAARAVAKARPSNVAGMLHTQVEELREPGALERVAAIDAAIAAPAPVSAPVPFVRRTARKAERWG